MEDNQLISYFRKINTGIEVMNNRFHDFDVRLTEVERDVSYFGDMFNDFSTYVEQRFNRLESRMDKLELRVGAIESRLDKIESKLDKVESTLSSIESKIENIESKLESIEKLIVNDLLKIKEKLAIA